VEKRCQKRTESRLVQESSDHYNRAGDKIRVGIRQHNPFVTCLGCLLLKNRPNGRREE
jgi:hypothetical protein